MPYIAKRRLRFGDGWIEPGEPVPEEEGRNYASLLTHGHIVEAKAANEMSDEELTAEVERLTTENEQLKAADTPESIEVPDGVTPGVTPGWPLDATTGTPLSLSEEQRSVLAEQEIGEGNENDPVLAILTYEGDFVIVSGGQEAEQAEADTGDAAAEAESPDPEPAGQTVTEATDAAIKLAEDEDIDLRSVVGSGKDGRVVEGDVQKAIAERNA